MKTTISVTLNNEIVIAARRKTDNISGTINDLLGNWVKVTKDKEMQDKEKTQLEIEQLRLELAQKEKVIDDFKKEKERRRPVRVIE